MTGLTLLHIFSGPHTLEVNPQARNKLIWKAGLVIGGGAERDALEAVAEKRTLSKLVSILNNVSHPLHDMLLEKKSVFSQRLISPGDHSCWWPSKVLTHPYSVAVDISGLGGC